MRKILLDTSGYTKLLLGEKSILEELNRADQIYMPSIVLGELFAGFKGGNKEQQNKKLLEKFLVKPGVETVLVSRETAEIFGEIKYSLLQAGTPLPTNDIWIASCALETGSVIITYDSHFLKVPGLRIWGGIKE